MGGLLIQAQKRVVFTVIFEHVVQDYVLHHKIQQAAQG